LFITLGQNVSLKLDIVENHVPSTPKRKAIVYSDLSTSLKRRLSAKDKGKGPAVASERHLQQISSSNNYNYELVSSLYGRIRDEESLGISYKDLLDEGGVTSETLEVCLKQMILAKLIDEVGFSHPRYIAHAHLDDWNVTIHDDHGSAHSFAPYVYSRFDGSLNTKVYRACSQSLLGIIANKPGISFAAILKRSRAVLNPIELRHLLEDLITNGFVKKVIVPTKVALDPFCDLFEESEPTYNSCYSTLKEFYMF
jgi:hypothetical protein